MSVTQLIDVILEHSHLLAYAVTFACGIVALKYYLGGGVCYSKARLDNKTVLITGGNTGIGKETAIDLARRGARVLIACRDKKRAETAAEEIKTVTGNTNVVVYILDLASLTSVRECAKNVLSNESRLDILINNAGIMWCEHFKTEDGFELQFGTNHLGHFLFTNLLLDKIKQSAPSRIVTVSSVGHTFVKAMQFDDLQSEKSYNRVFAYSQSKLANILFTRELEKRLHGTNVTVYSLHPGAVRTELVRHFETMHFSYRYLMLALYHCIVKYMIKSAAQGAQTSIYCAVDPDVVKFSGKYFSDCAVTRESLAAQDDEAAAKLWTLSEQMVGLNQK